MRRVVSVWLPTLATDWLRRHGNAPSAQAGAEAPLITAAHDGRRMVVAAVDAAAAALGLHVGMALAQAQALVPGLEAGTHPAEPEADAAALGRLAAWCLRYTPLSAADVPDGIWLDVTGCAHLHGGETKLLHDLVGRLVAQGITAHAAVADTPGAAHAVARFGRSEDSPSPQPWSASRPKPARGGGVFVVPVGETPAALAPLPIAALRLPAEIAGGLRLLGFESVAQLAATPRAPLTRRFGPLVATRLDQALGKVFEPIVPVFPPDLLQARRGFVEPLLTADAFTAVIDRLTGTVCTAMEQAGQGARRLDLLFERVDGSIQCLRIGTARPSRDAKHLARLLGEKLERVDPGLGVEVMRLVVPLAEPLAYAQASASLSAAEPAGQDVSALVDRLENRLGRTRVWRAEAVESDVPERSVRRVPALALALRETPKVGHWKAPRGGYREAQQGPRWDAALPQRPSWPADLPRPVRLLDPPQPVDAMALLPDQPPVAFTWRRVRHRVRRADGPERIAGEWWKRAGEVRSVRDYFRVEDEEGRRFWLFRRGDGEDAATGDLRWFLHGFF
jgi:protein ImuB